MKKRGIFVTYDGGKNWNKSLFVNNNTGAIDLISDPKDFNIQYAAFGKEVELHGILLEVEMTQESIKLKMEEKHGI